MTFSTGAPRGVIFPWPLWKHLKGSLGGFLSLWGGFLRVWGGFCHANPCPTLLQLARAIVLPVSGGCSAEVLLQAWPGKVQKSFRVLFGIVPLQLPPRLLPPGALRIQQEAGDESSTLQEGGAGGQELKRSLRGLFSLSVSHQQPQKCSWLAPTPIFSQSLLGIKGTAGGWLASWCTRAGNKGRGKRAQGRREPWLWVAFVC